ncbi:MAG: CRISPR-associated endonuclease Cas2 [Acidobacteriota bacterium]|nr:MAG: CRISPR-associated endonuclease Cas2 [Acidobacteriota bacterium]
MSRRRYLVTYDVSDDRRRTQIFKVLHGFGDWVQYSVFVCELNRREHTQLVARLTPLVHQREDQVLFVDLGPAEREAGQVVASVGRAYEAPTRVVVV